MIMENDLIQNDLTKYFFGESKFFILQCFNSRRQFSPKVGKISDALFSAPHWFHNWKLLLGAIEDMYCPPKEFPNLGSTRSWEKWIWNGPFLMKQFHGELSSLELKHCTTMWYYDEFTMFGGEFFRETLWFRRTHKRRWRAWG